MPDTVPYGRKTQRPSPVPEIHIVWMTAGLGCGSDKKGDPAPPPGVDLKSMPTPSAPGGAGPKAAPGKPSGGPSTP